jgi:hypothetical protein
MPWILAMSCSDQKQLVEMPTLLLGWEDKLSDDIDPQPELLPDGILEILQTVYLDTCPNTYPS